MGQRKAAGICRAAAGCGRPAAVEGVAAVRPAGMGVRKGVRERGRNEGTGSRAWVKRAGKKN